MSQHIDELTLSGVNAKPGGVACTVLIRDEWGKILLARGTSVPTDGTAGFAKGCLFIDTDVATGKRAVFENRGTTTSCAFALVGNKALQTIAATVTTTGNTDTYVIVPESGTLAGIDFSAVDALAANDTNYVTFSVTNLGQAGAGTTAMLAATDANTTKATGGTALAANTKRALTLHGTAANLAVAAGDRLLIRVAASGTLANTVTFPTFLLRFAG